MGKRFCCALFGFGRSIFYVCDLFINVLQGCFTGILNTVSRQDANFVVTGGTVGFHNDNLWCYQ